MVPDLRRAALLAACALALVSCGTPEGEAPSTEGGGEVPQLQGVAEQVGGATGAAEVLGQEAVQTAEATPPGLHITHIGVAPTTPELVDAINFTGFESGGPDALLELPVYGLNKRQDLYYLIVPVINEGKDIVRNLEGKAEFFDKEGNLIWDETVQLTHYPTRLQINPPSLPNKAEKQPELSKKADNYPLYYFPTNVGVFAFSVPDPAVAPNVRSWTLTFLVSQV